jgi:hypothetical protein
MQFPFIGIPLEGAVVQKVYRKPTNYLLAAEHLLGSGTAFQIQQ